MISRRFLSVALNSAICAGAAALVGCNQQPASPQAGAPAAAATTAPVAASTVAPAPAYTPPTADQLYQLVAPIALFPDKLVAQVLAGSTYPDQVSAADTFLAQNQSLQGAALQDAVNPQPWDPSIKGLTVFPKVLDQMAQNIPWTTALGTAYANDPTDVLNAIQVMRQRASKHGSLASSAKLHVVDQPAAAPVDDSYAAPPPDDGGDQPAYYGAGVVPAPQQTIEILPADQDTVYVPEYDPQTVYGDDVETYPGYRYEQPGYSTGQMVTTGALAFGAGIVVASLFEHSHREDRPNYGWNSWGMRWHGNDRGPGRDSADHDRWQRPAVVHNNAVYVSKSTTINNNRTVNNVHINGNRNNVGAFGHPPQNQQAGAGRPGMPLPNAPGNRPAGPARTAVPTPPMSRPNFNGALTKGQPARFAHPGTPPVIHQGAAPTPVAHPPEAAHQARINMPGTVPPTVTNRMPAPRPGDAAQPHNVPGRMGSMRTPGQRINPVAPPRTATPMPAHVPAAAPVVHAQPHPAPPVQPPPAATHPHPLPATAIVPHEPPRPAPVRHAPMPMPEHHDMPRPAPVQHEAPRPAPVQHQAPRPVPVQQRAAPRPQPPPQAHGNPPPQKGGHPPRKDDKDH